MPKASQAPRPEASGRALVEGLVAAYNDHDRARFFSCFAEEMEAVWVISSREQRLSRQQWAGWIWSQEIGRGDRLELLSVEEKGAEVSVAQLHRGFRFVQTRDGKVLPNSRHEKLWSETVTYRIASGLVIGLTMIRTPYRPERSDG